MPNSKLAMWGGRGLLFAAIVVFFAGLWGYSKYTRFHSRVRKLEQSGELISFDQLFHAVDDPANDSRTYLDEALLSCQEIQRAMIVEQLVAKLEQGSVDAVSLAKANAIFEKYPTLFPNIERAISAPEISIVENADLLPTLQLALVLEQKSMLLLESGDVEGALKQGENLIQLSNKIANPGLLNALMTARFQYGGWQVFCDCARTEDFANVVSEEKMKQLFQLMLQRPLLSSYREALLTERSLAIYMLAKPNPQGVEGFGWSDLTKRIPAGGVILWGNNFLDQMELAVERSWLPLSQQFEVTTNRPGFFASQMGLNADFYDRMRNQFGSLIASQRATMILMALRLAKDGENRDTWSAEYLKGIGVPSECVVDPFSDDTMKVVLEQNVWQVYSVGPDKIDNRFKEGTDDRGMRIELMKRQPAN